MGEIHGILLYMESPGSEPALNWSSRLTLVLTLGLGVLLLFHILLSALKRKVKALASTIQSIRNAGSHALQGHDKL